MFDGALKEEWQEKWDKIGKAYFTERFAEGVEDLEHAFRMFSASSHYDGSLDERAVLKAWRRLCEEGTGHFIIVESPVLEKVLNSRFIAVSFSAYITRQYATEIAAPNDTRNVCMDFMRQYLNSSEANSPAHTQDSIQSGYGRSDFRMYFFSAFTVLNAKLPSQSRIPRVVSNGFSECIQGSTQKMFGGFSYHGWFNNVCGEPMKNGYLALGTSLLREYPNNSTVESDKRRYLLCVTRDQEASGELGIPANASCHVEPLCWFDTHVFNSMGQRLNFTDDQKAIAYLLALGYTQKQITSYLFNVGTDHEYFDAHHRTVRQEIKRIREKFLAAQYVRPPGNERQLVTAIIANMQEVRPVIVPLYPAPSVERPIRKLI